MDTYQPFEHPSLPLGEVAFGLATPGEMGSNLFSRLRSLGQTATEKIYGLYESAQDMSRNVAAVALSSGVAALSLVGGVVQASEARPDGLGHTSAALADASCAQEALQKPKTLKGRYDTYTDPNNHLYRERISVPSVSNCSTLGKRTVHYFQEINRGGWILQEKSINSNFVITTKSVPNINGEDFYIRTNKAATKNQNFRAAHLCVNQGPGLPDTDKKDHTLGRPTAIITWTPSDGTTPSTKTFYGKASPLCK